MRRFYFRLDFWFNLISFGFAGARARLSFGLLFVLYLTRSNSVDSAAGRKAVIGVVGSSVLLDPEYGADLRNSDIVWTFTASNKSPVIILDYDPNYRAVEPNEDFKSRLHFNAFVGSLVLSNLKPGDQGIYTIRVNGQVPRLIELFITGLNVPEFYCIPGSSVSFPGVDEDQRELAKYFLWKTSSGNAENGTSMGMVRFQAGDAEPTFVTKYKGRLDFSPSNGSCVLHNLTYEDEGLYTLFINLPTITVRTVRLYVIDKLSKPSILSNSSSLDSTVQLTCDLFGIPHEYQWLKDGGEISQHHRLINGNRSLIIPGATKGDCGTYTCIAINRVGSAQADYALTIYGIPPEQIMIIAASIIGLVFSAVSFFGLFVLCVLKRESSQVSLRQPKRLFLGLFSSNTLSLVATFIALVSWIAIKGAAPASVAALCIVAVLLVLAVIATISIWKSGYPCLQKLLKCTGYRASIDFCGIMSSFIVLAVSIVILTEEIQQNNQGCQSTILSWSILIPLLVILVIIVAVFIVIWRCINEDTKRDAKYKQAQQLSDPVYS